MSKRLEETLQKSSLVMHLANVMSAMLIRSDDGVVICPICKTSGTWAELEHRQYNNDLTPMVCWAANESIA